MFVEIKRKPRKVGGPIGGEDRVVSPQGYMLLLVNYSSIYIPYKAETVTYDHKCCNAGHSVRSTGPIKTMRRVQLLQTVTGQ